MKSRARVLILCFMCVARVSKVVSEEITEFGARTSVVQDEDLARKLTRERDERADGPIKFRDKRALGLLLSGLAQIFGYTVTPIQLASLANPNMTAPAAMPNSTAMGNVTRPQTASSRPMSTNTIAPRQQETVRFTGVVNFGNNSDIIGHLQRYEQMFHGRRNNTMAPAMMTTARPVPSMPKPAANISVDPRTSSPTRPPLLTPFFVKIPLPLAPNLPPATMPIGDLKLSYPFPLITVADESIEDQPPPETRKEQETVYRNNEDTERYAVEEKEIYDEKDVMKPVSKYTHRLYVDEPSLSKQQDERYNEVQRKQEEYVAELKEQEAQRSREQDDYDREDEIKERHESREEEIANRNRAHASEHSSAEDRRPAYDGEEDDETAEKYEERAGQENRSSESSEQTVGKDEREKTERYPDYDDQPNKVGGYKQDDDLPPPTDLNKYIEVTYNQQLPIGDYFHEGNPEEIRDSYGEVLTNKKPEDDRLSDYFSMFKHPYLDGYDHHQQDPENASQEEKREETPIADGYEEHLKRIQKLREEYALPAPESKYEEYEINDESEANGRQNEGGENRTAAKSKKTGPGKEDVRERTTSGSSRNQLQREQAKPQEELDKYTPLIVPIRYVDASDRVEQASTRQVKYKKAEKKSNGKPVTSADNVDVSSKEKQPTPQVAGLPEGPRQLHEGEHKELRLWPPPFDYAFDNTERTNTIVPANPQSYPLNYYQHIVTSIAGNDANGSDSSNQPTGYLVVVGNPVHPYRYPYNIYYFPKEAMDPQNQDAEGAQHQHYVPRQNVDQQSARANPTEYNRNETAKSITRDYYYQPQAAPADALKHYRYAFGKYVPVAEELLHVDARNHTSNTENWSNRIHQSQPRADGVVGQPSPTLAQLQNVASLNPNVQSVSSERQRYSQPLRRRKSSRSREQRQDDREATKATTQRSVPRRKSFDDPQSAHDFFGFSKNDYSFDGESDNASKVAKENGRNTKESRVFVAPEPAAYHHDESTVKHTDEPENDTEKAVVREYRNKVATLKVSEQRRLRPNGPIHYVNFTRNI